MTAKPQGRVLPTHWEEHGVTYRFNNAPPWDQIETAPHHFHDWDYRVHPSPLRVSRLQALRRFYSLLLGSPETPKWRVLADVIFDQATVGDVGTFSAYSKYPIHARYLGD